MKKLITLIVVLCAFYAVSATTYYSKNNSNPATAANWAPTRGGTGTAPSNFTTSGDVFVIQSPNNMATTGTWTLGASVTLQIENGATLTANNAVTINAAGTFQIDNGGTYVHNNSTTTAVFNGTCTFGASSQFTVTASASTLIAASKSIDFGNLTINTASGDITCNGSVHSVQGNLLVQATGTGSFRLGAASFPIATTISGNLTVQAGIFTFNTSSGGTPTVTVNGNVILSGGVLNACGSSGTSIFNITGDMTLSGGSFNGSSNSSGISTTTIGGNLAISSGTFGMNSSTASNTVANITGNVTISGTGIMGNSTGGGGGYTINITGNLNIQTGGSVVLTGTANSTRVMNIWLGGNFNMTGGTFDCSSVLSSTTPFFRFAGGQPTATFTQSGGTFTTFYSTNSNRGFDWSIATGKTVTFNNAFTLPTGRSFKDSGTLVTTVPITNNGTFTIGGAAVTGTFQLNDGGSVTGTALTYAALGRLSYNGTSAAQTTTDLELPTTAAPNDIIINNSNGVTLHASKAIAGALTMTAGKLALGANTLTVGSATGSASSYVNASSAGKLKQGVGGSAVLYPIGTSSTYNPVTLTNAGTLDNYSVGVISGAPANLTDATQQVQDTWTIAEDVNGASNLTVQTQWSLTDEGPSFNRNSNLKVGRYTGAGTSWEKYAAVLAGANPYTATASGFTAIGTAGVAFSTGNFFVNTADVALSSPAQVAAGNIGQGTTNNVIYSFQVAASTADATLNAVAFTTVGTYTATDIVNYKLWYSATNIFGAAVQVGSAITTSLGAGAHTFNSMIAVVPNGSTGYFFITADIAFTATTGNINIAAIAPSDLTFEAANVTGSTTVGGAQTIVATTVMLASANPAVAASTISRTINKNPIYKFTLTPATAGALLNQVDFTTGGTYAAADLSRFQLWYKASDDLSTAVQIGTDINTSLGTGTHSFTGLSQSINLGATGFFWITTDVPVSATLLNTVNVSALTMADITLASGSKTGTAFAGGDQTITAASDATKYFRSKATGNWSDYTTWESSDDNISWFNATLSPTSAATAITVLSGHTVTVTAGVTIDDLTVNAGGQVTVNSSVTLIIANGAADPDVTINGKLVSAGTITTTGTLTIGATGEYQHAQNGGTIPTATWATGSTANITGLTTTSPGGRGQVFSNFIFDCSGLTAQIVWGSSLPTGPTGAGTFQVTNTMTVKRTGSSTLQLHSSGGQERITVGNYVQNGGSVYLINGYGGTSGGADRIFTVNGTFTIDNSVAASPLFSISNGTAASVKPFTLNVGGDMTIGTGATVQADITNIPSSSLIFNGTGTQVLTVNGILGDEVITVNKASGTVNLASDISVTNALNMTAGQLALGSFNVTLVSTATRTASIPATALATPFTYTSGRFIVQRYIAGGASSGTPGRRAFRFLGHPFNNYLDLTQLTNQIDITGTGATTAPTAANFTQSGTNAPSAFWFNPLLADNATNDAGWQPFTNALPVSGSDANAWKLAQGIRVLVRGAKGEGLTGGTYTASNVTLSMAGQVNVATTPIGVTLATNAVPGAGWNLVANPLPSTIEIQAKLKALRTAAIGGANSNLGAVAYVWNPNKAATVRGGYDAIDLTAATSYYLPMSSVVLVQTTTDGNTALTFSESDKSTSAAASLFRTTGINNAIVLQLMDAGNNQLDETFIRFNNGAATKFESSDGGKLLNDYALYSVTNDNVKTYINSQPEPSNDTKIRLGIYSGAAKDFTIKATELNLPIGMDVYLKDNFTNKLELVTGTNYTYTFSTTSNAASSGAGRFELLFSKSVVPMPLPTGFSIKLSPNPATDKLLVTFSNEEQAGTILTITNAEGKLVKTINAGNVLTGQLSIDVKGLAKGTYYVTLNNGKQKKTEKLQVQ